VGLVPRETDGLAGLLSSLQEHFRPGRHDAGLLLHIMRDLQTDIALIRSWFSSDDGGPVLIVRPGTQDAAAWLSDLAVVARRCYVSDEFLDERAAEVGTDKAEVLAALLPDRGAVMAGDFGEIITFLFLGSRDEGTDVVAPKKWRLKGDRLKAAPYSDVVQFVVPHWPASSDEDRLICAEVKTKSTDGPSTPIPSAIADSEKDQLGRLAKTLAWFKDRALVEDLGSTSIPLIDRFLHATDHPAADKRFWAVAVICTSLVEAELATVPEELPSDSTIAVIAMPDLKDHYEALFGAIVDSVVE
jgi:hypothetical protein